MLERTAATAEIVFLPVDEIDELLKTATFEVVGYHRISPTQFEIERPGAPYHVVLRQGYAFLADDIPPIQALQVTPDQLTRTARSKFELAILADLKQVPLPAKRKFLEDWRDQIEPWLQSQDNEQAETANFRKSIGKLVLNLFERFLLDAETVTAGVHLDPKTRHFSMEAIVKATPGSSTASEMNRWTSTRSEFLPLVSADVPAGLAINLPLSGLAEQILGPTNDSPQKGTRLQAGIQLVGAHLGEFSLIAAINGTDAIRVNAAIPDLIMKLENTGWILTEDDTVELHRKVILHRLIPASIPSVISTMSGPDAEFVVGQGTDVVWLGIGPPDQLNDLLRQAIDLIDQPQPVDKKTSRIPLVRAQFQAKRLPELVTSDLLLPTVDAATARTTFAAGNDGFSLTIEPVENGILLRIEAEEGFVRLVGRDWIKQIEP